MLPIGSDMLHNSRLRFVRWRLSRAGSEPTVLQFVPDLSTPRSANGALNLVPGAERQAPDAGSPQRGVVPDMPQCLRLYVSPRCGVVPVRVS